jgi:hypothetical protein
LFSVGGGRWGRMMEGLNLTQAHCKHIVMSQWKPSVQIIYGNRNVFKRH